MPRMDGANALKLINLVYCNHGSYTVIQDHIEYFTNGLTLATIKKPMLN